MDDLKFSKSRQLNPTSQNELSREEKGRHAKRLCVALYEAFIFETGLNPFDFKVSDVTCISHEFLQSLDWDHVCKRSTNPGLIYSITNWQLLDCKRNNEKKDGEDFRTAEFKNWINTVAI